MSDAQAIAPEETETPKSESALLLDSLEIENFRCFRHLTIPKLGRVNLITGKNNVGKSTLLEAISIFMERGSWDSWMNILERRGEPVVRDAWSYTSKKQWEVLSPLFFGKYDNFQGEEKRIFIGNMNEAKLALKLWRNNRDRDMRPAISFAKRSNEITPGFTSEVPSQQIGEGWVFDDDGFKFDKKYIHISSSGINSELVTKYWKDVEFSDKEDDIARSLRIIDGNVVRAGLLWGKSTAVVLSKDKSSSSISSYGEGMSRLFGLTLGLLNNKNGVVMIDEIENGFHYSVIADIFRFIFTMSETYNIQIFMTTHSLDCIKSFQQVSSEDSDPNSGMLIRLDNRDGNIVATNFDEDGLEVMTRHGLEVR